jgi:hypothetical protein
VHNPSRGSSLSLRRQVRLFATIRRKRFAVIGSIIAVSLLSALVGIRALEDSLEDKLYHDLKLSSEGKPDKTYVNGFDLICFTLNNSSAKEELLRENRRLGANFSASLEACGVNRSCCNLWTQASGIVGLVKNNQVLCVEIYKFDYWNDKDAPRCMQPKNLRFEKQTSSPSRNLAGRPAFNPRRPSYMISEEAQ